MQAKTNPEHLKTSRTGCAPTGRRSCSTRTAARCRRLAACPEGDLRMGANPHVNGGKIRKAAQAARPWPTTPWRSSTPGRQRTTARSRSSGEYFADVFRLNEEEKNFRIVCPDEVASNRLGAVFEATASLRVAARRRTIDTGHAPDGRVVEVLSEHNCQGWLQGYVLTGRHGVFPCYEAFIPIVDGMVNQYGKFLKMSRDEAPWREPVASLNYLLTSGRLAPGPQRLLAPDAGLHQLDAQPARRSSRRIYLPPDANTLLATMDDCLRGDELINLVIASKHPLPQWLSMDEADEHVARGRLGLGVGQQRRRRPRHRAGRAAATIPTIELLAAAQLLREEVPDLKVRFVNVTDLFTLATPAPPATALSQARLRRELFTPDRPVIFNFHGYPSAVHQLIHRRPQPGALPRARLHRGGHDDHAVRPAGDERRRPLPARDRGAEPRRRPGAPRPSAACPASSPCAPSQGAEDAIEKFRAEARRARAPTIREEGNDPPEILQWAWSPNGAAALS